MASLTDKDIETAYILSVLKNAATAPQQAIRDIIGARTAESRVERIAARITARLEKMGKPFRAAEERKATKVAAKAAA